MIKGLKKKKTNLSFPDFILVLYQDKNALNELIKSKIPILGLTDINDLPNHYNYNIIGNNNSFEVIEFIFYLLLLSLKENIFQEQKLFYQLILIKIKNIIKYKIFK